MVFEIVVLSTPLKDQADQPGDVVAEVNYDSQELPNRFLTRAVISIVLADTFPIQSTKLGTTLDFSRRVI